MPLPRTRSPELPIERAFVLGEELAGALADLCRRTGDVPRDFIADALVLAIDEELARLEREDLDHEVDEHLADLNR